MKKGVTTDFNRPLFSIMNPELTYSVNSYQTACGIVDIMAHTMERYFTNHPATDLTDRISESILVSVISAGMRLVEDPCDYNARANVMWASSLSHNNLTGCGRENALPVHQLEHALSGEFDHVAHGAGLAVLFPAWAKWIYKQKPQRFAQFARRVWGVEENNDEKASILGIQKMSEFFAYIGMPSSLREFNIPKESIQKLVQLCTFNYTRTVKSYVDMGEKELEEIFNSCY
jgi:alcohol dehydrogenase YqhD (iron-dependent ADH family)